MVLLHFPFESAFKYIHSKDSLISSDFLHDTISSYLGTNDFHLYCGKKKLHSNEGIPVNASVHCVFSLPGGKGGFGSMLRAIGAQIEKTTNREACRDLSGRRLRDINEEQRLKRWIAKDAERQAEKMRRRQERLERLKSKPKHNFADVEFEKALSQMPERIDESLSVGLQKAKDPVRKVCEVINYPKEKRTWLDAELSSSTSDSGSEEEGSPTAKRCKRDSSTKNDKSNSDLKLSSFSSSEDSNERGLSLALPSEEISSSDSFIGESSSGKDKSQNAASTSDISSSGREEENDMKPVICPPPIEEENAMKSDITFPFKEQNDIKSEILSPAEKQNGMKADISSPFKEQMDIKSEISSPVEEQNNIKADILFPSKNQNYVEQRIESNISCPTATSSLNTTPPVEEKVDDSPIDLLKFESVAELQSLGLDKLKLTLVARGLKCGGTLSDRAQRLWKIRNLQPNEYPPNLLAKSKK